MNKDEFIEIVKMIKTAYPREKFLETGEQFEMWFNMLKDIPFGICQAAIITWVTENPRSPAISDIRGLCHEVTTNDDSWEKAWDTVMRAISRYGSYREEEALDSMDELTRRTTETFGFRYLCFTDSDNLQTVRAQFRDVYKNYAKKKRTSEILPGNVRKVIEDIKQKQIGVSYEQ